MWTKTSCLRSIWAAKPVPAYDLLVRFRRYCKSVPFLFPVLDLVSETYDLSFYIGKSQSLSSCQNVLLISMWQQKVWYPLLKLWTTMNCMGLIWHVFFTCSVAILWQYASYGYGRQLVAQNLQRLSSCHLWKLWSRNCCNVNFFWKVHYKIFWIQGKLFCFFWRLRLFVWAYNETRLNGGFLLVVISEFQALFPCMTQIFWSNKLVKHFSSTILS